MRNAYHSQASRNVRRHNRRRAIHRTMRAAHGDVPDMLALLALALIGLLFVITLY